MTAETVLAKQVAAWVDQNHPGDKRLRGRAVEIALRCFAGGGSVSESCDQALRYARSWTQHPSRSPRAHVATLAVAS